MNFFKIAVLVFGLSNVAAASNLKVGAVARDANGLVLAMSQPAALNYCAQKGERLPTHDEVEQAWIDGTLGSDGIPFKNPRTSDPLTTRTYVWTATLADNDSSFAVVYSHLDESGIMSTFDSVASLHAVRCAR